VTTTVSLQAVVACWAAHLGCSEVQLTQPSTSVVRNGPDLASYRGATVVFRPPACVLAVPADWHEPAASRVGHRPPAEVFDIAHSSIDPARPPVFGCYADQVLAAAGMLEPWGLGCCTWAS
jgi:hypothetical protein